MDEGTQVLSSSRAGIGAEGPCQSDEGEQVLAERWGLRLPGRRSLYEVGRE